jgi:hypothetical protein
MKMADEYWDPYIAYPHLKYFAFEHFPEKLANISKPFRELAFRIANQPDYDRMQATVAIQKLLEAKDAAVRAAL